MATDVKVPAMGESVTQAILVKWHKRDGEAVRVDDPLTELETDKANVDVPAQVAGGLRQGRKEGETVAVGDVIARIEDGAATGAGPAKAPTTTTAKVTGGMPADKATGIPSPMASSSADAGAKAGPNELSPAVARLVEENNLNPSS